MNKKTENRIDGQFILDYLQAEVALKKASAALNMSPLAKAYAEAKKARDRYREVLKNRDIRLDSKSEKYLALEHKEISYKVHYFKPVLSARVENTRSEMYGKIIKLLSK